MGYFNVEPVEKVVELVQQVLYVKAVSKGIISMLLENALHAHNL